MESRNTFVFALALTSILTFAGCQTAPTPEPKRDAAADVTAIKAQLDQYTAAFNSNDAAAAAAYFADEAIMMGPNQAAVEGKQAIQAAYDSLFKESAAKGAFTSIEVQVVGDWAYQRGNYAQTVTPKSGKPIEDSGKFLEILKRQSDGSWKSYRLVWNTNNPLPSAAGKKK